MTEEVWSRDEIDSPCVRICVIEPASRQCLGCKRTIDEIARWSAMRPEERAAVMAELPTRPEPSGGRRGGRAARLKR